MSKNNKIAVFKSSQTMLNSIISDCVTFGFLLLCIWFSHGQGGGWWTFFTCSLFLLILFAKNTESNWIKMKTKEQAIKWANSLPEDEL